MYDIHMHVQMVAIIAQGQINSKELNLLQAYNLVYIAKHAGYKYNRLAHNNIHSYKLNDT